MQLITLESVTNDRGMQRFLESPASTNHANGQSLAVCFWRIDIIGVLPMSKGGAKYVIVVVDYFTKWAEEEPLAKPWLRKWSTS